MDAGDEFAFLGVAGDDGGVGLVEPQFGFLFGGAVALKAVFRENGAGEAGQTEGLLFIVAGCGGGNEGDDEG